MFPETTLFVAFLAAGSTAQSRDAICDGYTRTERVASAGIPDETIESVEWYYSPAWQHMESAADADLASGRYESFDDFEDFIQSLQ